jgi:putative (di)nucleoside polyphosphate hydrolase
MNTPNQYFRAGAGSVIFTAAKEIYTFERADNPGTWQLQQGGMDAGETNEETLWRELREETGLLPENFVRVIPYPNWLYYTYPENIRHKLRDPNALGQIHRWYFLELKEGQQIDLSLAQDKEFLNVKKTNFSEFLTEYKDFKTEVFALLHDYLENEI